MAKKSKLFSATIRTIAAAMLLSACGGETPPPAPSIEAPSARERVIEALVLLEGNKDRCLEQAKRLMANPFDFDDDQGQREVVVVLGKRYLPETLEVLTVAGRIRTAVRGLLTEAMRPAAADPTVGPDVHPQLAALQRSEASLCRELENYPPKPAPREAIVSRHLSDFLGGFKTLSRRFPISDEERAAVRTKFQSILDEALASAGDKLEAHREARDIVARDGYEEQARNSTFFVPKEIGPKPLTPAELAAVDLAAGYLEQGPRAWIGRFANASPWTELETSVLIAELLARLGPNAGVTWSLQKASEVAGDHAAVFRLEHASGFDEVLLLELSEDDAGAWKIGRLATNIDQPPGSVLQAALRPAARARSGAGALATRLPTPLALAALLALATATTLIHSTLRPRAATAGAALFAAVLLACSGESVPVTPQPAAIEAPRPQPLERLGDLAPLKASLARNDETAAQPEFARFVTSSSAAGEVAALWQAQWLLQHYDLEGAEQALEKLAGSERPLIHLLKARLAYFRGSFDKLERNYIDAQLEGIDHDQLRLEAAEAHLLVGLDSQAEAAFESAAEMGSRLPLPYVMLARLYAQHGRPEDAEQMFRHAWRLAPLPRHMVFEDGALAWLATRPGIVELLEVSSPTEPTVSPKAGEALARGARSALPESFKALVSGDLLQVSIGANQLHVPGGGMLAPRNARLVTGSELEEQEQRIALAKLERLINHRPRLLLALTHPRAAATIVGLARSNEWDRVVDLTEGILQQVDRVSPDVVKLRALALERSDRRKDARQLLLALARSDRAKARRDPDMFFQLGELLVRTGEYDLAIRLIERGNALSSLFGRPDRVRQIRLEQAVVADQNTYTGRGFELRYPRVSGKEYPAKVTTVLAAERGRIGKWVPIDARVPIHVDLYPFLDFMSAYGGPLGIVGLFDGRVRVPFADLQSLHPRIVSVMSHELAHAMIAARTNDNAPKWFHEGLAQHIEMDQPLNPIPDLMAKGSVLSLPVIEAILGGMAERQYVELAYSQSVWAVHFIESAFGVRGIHSMLDQFAQGATTAEAIERGLGLTLEEFDRRAWDWCANEAPMSWKVEVKRYDRELNGLIAKAPSARRKDMPRLKRDAPKAAESREVSRASMALWFKSYQKQISGVNATLLSVLTMGTGQNRWDQGSACSYLLGELKQFRSKRLVLNTPDPALSRALQTTYASAEKLAKSCMAGPTASTDSWVKKTLADLQAANRELARHGLTP